MVEKVRLKIRSLMQSSRASRQSRAAWGPDAHQICRCQRYIRCQCRIFRKSLPHSICTQEQKNPTNQIHCYRFSPIPHLPTPRQLRFSLIRSGRIHTLKDSNPPRLMSSKVFWIIGPTSSRWLRAYLSNDDTHRRY